MQYQYLNCDDGSTIAYQKIEGELPGIIFLGGLMSDLTGTKANFLANYCKNSGRAFVRFDYYGHGKSSGEFQQGTIGRWKTNALTILDKLTEGPQILVGSSMGGWLMILVARERPDRVAGLVGIAAAPDFTQSIIDSLDIEQKRSLEIHGIYYLSSVSQGVYPLVKYTIDEAFNHHVLGGAIEINCPMRLLHGLNDEYVSWQQSLRLMERVDSNDVELTIVKTGDHRLARDEDLNLLAKTIQEILL